MLLRKTSRDARRSGRANPCAHLCPVRRSALAIQIRQDAPWTWRIVASGEATATSCSWEDGDGPPEEDQFPQFQLKVPLQHTGPSKNLVKCFMAVPSEAPPWAPWVKSLRRLRVLLSEESDIARGLLDATGSRAQDGPGKIYWYMIII